MTADNLAVLPENDSRVVETLASCLGFDLKQLFTLEKTTGDLKHPFPTPSTIGDVLTKYYDLQVSASS
jgi:sulfite reductase alpha subunit-like flavoprotein